ncbi:hypothetical protein [Streptomyces sp. TRM68367]|uniref:hypothetical protein n=1 Tax=Streptomyces sp. TRM68367 TaxID=2758415 RepID=UPI00165CACC1|nr:hypothetical protein [Streptomyces sp. TRM68367]MBC9730686.1 hypothetical protein [Streptomyces sp. TRM68367]
MNDRGEGLQGVHIADLLDRLKKKNWGFEAWDIARLRRWCEAAGFPVTKTKVGAKSPTWGIRADQLVAVVGMPLLDYLDTLDQTTLRTPTEAPAEGGAEAPAEAAEQPPADPSPAPLLSPEQEVLSGPVLRVVPDPSPETAA